MEGVPQGMDAFIKFLAEHWEAWSDHIGRKQVQELANTEWDRINWGHGWVPHLQHAIQQVVRTMMDSREHWKLLAAYEPYTGTPWKLLHLVFIPRESWKRTKTRFGSTSWTSTGSPTLRC